MTRKIADEILLASLLLRKGLTAQIGITKGSDVNQRATEEGGCSFTAKVKEGG